MPLSLNNNRGSVYSGRMKIEVLERECLTAKFTCGEWHLVHREVKTWLFDSLLQQCVCHYFL